MHATFDHLLYAAPTLDDGVRRVCEATGVEATPGGRHPGVGTWNALASLGGRRYLEIIAPDPDQRQRNDFGQRVAAVTTPGWLSWCARVEDADALVDLAARAGVVVGSVTPMTRVRGDGTLLSWRLVFPTGDDPCVPFFIEWQGEVHPSDDAPRGLDLTSWSIEHPDPDALRPAWSLLTDPPPVRRAAVRRFDVTLETPLGMVRI